MNVITASALIIILGGLSIVIFIPTIIFTILSMHRGSLLMEYLHDKYYKKWAQLTSIGSFGFGVVNPFRSIPYLYIQENIKDIKLQTLKQRARFWTTLAIIGYVLFFILLFLMFYIINGT